MSISKPAHWHIGTIRSSGGRTHLRMDGSLMVDGGLRMRAVRKRLGLFLRNTTGNIDCDVFHNDAGLVMAFQTLQVTFSMMSSMQLMLTMDVRTDHTVGAIQIAVNSEQPHALTQAQLYECGSVLGAICSLFMARPMPGAGSHEDMRPEIHLCPEFEPHYVRLGYDLGASLEKVAEKMRGFKGRMGVLRLRSDAKSSRAHSLREMIAEMCKGW